MDKDSETPIKSFASSEAVEEMALHESRQIRHSGIWLQIFRKDSGEATITYDEALDEALCYAGSMVRKKRMMKNHGFKNSRPADPRAFGQSEIRREWIN
jgi:hypothetical protein